MAAWIMPRVSLSHRFLVLIKKRRAAAGLRPDSSVARGIRGTRGIREAGTLEEGLPTARFWGLEESAEPSQFRGS